MRKFLIAGAALAVIVTGLVVGSPAKAGVGPSQSCEEPWVGGTTTRTRLVNNANAYAAVAYGLPNTSDFSVNLCVSDRAYGTPSFLLGGRLHLRFHQTAPNTYAVELRCFGDTTMLGTTSCLEDVVTTTTVHTSPTVGGSTSAFVRVENSTLVIGTTGADSGGTSNTTGTNPEVTYGGTCSTVAGITPPVGTRCSSAAVDAQVARGDVTTAIGGTTGTCLVTAGSCLVYQPRAGVILFNDTANDTSVELLGTPLLTDPRSPQCYGSC